MATVHSVLRSMLQDSLQPILTKFSKLGVNLRPAARWLMARAR